MFNSLLVLAFTVYYFYTNNNYIIRKVPDTILVSMCGFNCLPQPDEQDARMMADMNQTYCTDPTAWDITFDGRRYKNIECAGRCGSSMGSSGSCIHSSDLMETSMHDAFFPTFYQETTYTPLLAGGGCPSGMTASWTGTGRACTKEGSYWVAGANHNRFVFNHEFSLTPHVTALDMFLKSSVKRSHSGSFHSKGWEQGLATILFNAKGEQQAKFEQSEAPNITLQDLLRAAAYTSSEDEQLFTSHLTFDTGYTHDDTGINLQAPLRLTGAHLTVDLYTTDTGKCPVYDEYARNVKVIQVEAGRPVSCMTVFADRRMVHKDVSHPVGTNGMRHRRFHGVKVTFRKMGNFEFSDDKAIFRNITVFFVWIRVPLWLTTTFCLLFLGKLSSIYSRVLNQELNLKNACKGLMARLMHHSAAFMDLQDNEKGISKQRIYDRFKDFLLDNEDIDEDELNRFVEFVFDGLKGTGHHPNSDKNYVSLQEFCEVCSNNEPLNFQALVQLFDNDRTLGFLEWFFLDPSLRDSQEGMGGEAETTKTEPVDFTKVKFAGATHSRVETAAAEVEHMLKDLKAMEGKAIRTASDLEIGDDVLGLNPNDGTSGPVEAKLDQRESFCSIGDEEDECAGGKDDS